MEAVAGGTADRARTPRPRRLVLATIVIGTAARLLLAATIGLGVDESYAVTVARGLSLSYFDHPPLSFWIPGVLARVAGSESALLLRLPFIALFAGTTWLTYRLGARLFGERAGAWAAVLLNLTPFFALAAGGWILPDGPLDLFLAAAALAVAHVLFIEPDAHAWRWWLLAGFALGGALLSKYHAVLFGAGLLLFLLTDPGRRAWLRRPEPYAAAAIALAMFTPVVAWNAQHDWISFSFQTSRAGAAGGIHPLALLQNLGGQAGYLLPWIWAPLLWLLITGLARGPRDARRWFLCCLAVGPVALFTLASLKGDPGLPHWPMPGFLMLFPLLGAAVDRGLEIRPAFTRRWLAFSAIAFSLLAIVAATHAATGWIARAEPEWFTRGDPAYEVLDWRGLRDAADARALFADSATFVAPVSWVQAAKAAYALGPSVPVLVLNQHPHHYPYLRDPRTLIGHDAIIVIRADPRADTTASAYAPYFERIDPLGRIPITHAGERAFDLFLFRAHRLLRPYSP